MSTLNFPTSPSLNDTYSFGTKTWIWNGSAWQLQATGAINNTPIGNVTPASGAFTTLSATGNVTGSVFVANSGNVTISAAAGNNSVILSATGTGAVDVGSVKIINLADPTNPQDAATKTYVDEVAEGLKAKPSVYLATTENLTATYDNGTAGVGSTLTATTNEQFPLVDGEQANTTQGFNGVLVKNQTDPAENGRYNLTTLGDAGNAWVLTRCSLCDTATEIPGSYTFVQDGDVNAGTGWVQTVADPATFVVGTDAIIVVQFSGAGTYTAGTGLTLANNVFSISNTAVTSGSYGSGDQVATFTVNAQGQLTAAANTAITANAANLTGTVLNSSIVTSSLTTVGTLSTLSVSGNVTSTYFLGNANIQYTAGSTEPTGNLIGAQWYNTSNDVLYEWQTDGTSNYWIDITGPVIGSNGAASGTTLTNGTSNISVALNSNATVNIGGTANVVVWSTAGEYVTGVVSATGNISGGNLISTGAVYSNYNTNTANVGSFMATGGNTKGGTGYLDFLVAQNTSGGATNPYKWFRVNPTGGLEVINSAYTQNIFSLTDAGALSLPVPIYIGGSQAVNGPAFSAYAAAILQTIPNNTQTKVLFQTEEFDTNNNYTNSTFTPTVAGYYQLNAEVRLDGVTGTGECMIILYKNGSEYKRGWNSSGTQWASNFWAMQVSSLAYANGTGDYFEIYVQQGSGGSITVTAVNNVAITWFNGCMLRGA